MTTRDSLSSNLQSIAQIRETVQDMVRIGSHEPWSGLPLEHAVTLLDHISMLESERAAWEKRAYQAEDEANRARAVLDRLGVVQRTADETNESLSTKGE